MLGPTDKRKAADELRRMAADLDRQAGQDEERAAALDRGRRFRGAYRQAVQKVARMIASGMTAPQIAAALPDYSESQIDALTAKAAPVARRIQIAERDREISRLARKLTNRELAERFKLSEVHISRIIGKQWREKRNYPLKSDPPA
jgi:DNA-binding CsgD family transcriptional regulator